MASSKTDWNSDLVGALIEQVHENEIVWNTGSPMKAIIRSNVVEVWIEIGKRSSFGNRRSDAKSEIRNPNEVEMGLNRSKVDVFDLDGHQRGKRGHVEEFARNVQQLTLRACSEKPPEYQVRLMRKHSIAGLRKRAEANSTEKIEGKLKKILKVLTLSKRSSNGDQNYSQNNSIAARYLDERAFSCLKRVKTYLRSTISESRLPDLATITIKREVLADLTIRELQKPFLEKKT
eukprot:gene8009-13917_t